MDIEGTLEDYAIDAGWNRTDMFSILCEYIDLTCDYQHFKDFIAQKSAEAEANGLD